MKPFWSKHFWRYIFARPEHRYYWSWGCRITETCEWPYIWEELKFWLRDYRRCAICRWRGHSDSTGRPYGVVYYNPNGWEPDMHCLNCGDDLG